MFQHLHGGSAGRTVLLPLQSVRHCALLNPGCSSPWSRDVSTALSFTFDTQLAALHQDQQHRACSRIVGETRYACALQQWNARRIMPYCQLQQAFLRSYQKMLAVEPAPASGLDHVPGRGLSTAFQPISDRMWFSIDPFSTARSSNGSRWNEPGVP